MDTLSLSNVEYVKRGFGLACADRRYMRRLARKSGRKFVVLPGRPRWYAFKETK